MTKTIEFNTLNDEAGEWSMDEAIKCSMDEASIEAEVEAMERRLKWCRERILNRGNKQVMKQVKREEQA